MRLLVNGKVVSIEAITARQACIEALQLEPTAKCVSILGKSGKRALAKFTREELLADRKMTKLTGGVVHEFTKVTFGDKYQRITLECRDDATAAQLAHAVAAGVISITSKAE